MDNDQILRQFQDIEKKVESVIEVCKSFKTRNSELLNKIERLEEELQHKIEAEHSYNEQKALIRSKIDSLLVRLGDIKGS